MEFNEYLQVAQQGIETAIWVSAPVLVFGLAAGLVISVIQAATQINDASVAFIPKIGAVVVALLVFGSFMVGRIADFTRFAYGKIPDVLP
jgi:flagellar biosynthetic protein FliQ